MATDNERVVQSVLASGEALVLNEHDAILYLRIRKVLVTAAA